LTYGKPYDEQLYLDALQKRNSPLRADPATGFGWRPVAGFAKFSNETS
jgi:hypothetical protein